MTSGFCRARWLFSLFALAAVTGYFGAVWAGGYGLRLELGWKTSQYFFNYQDLGFVKRALIGTILHPFPALQRVGWLFTIAGLLVAGFAALFAQALSDAVSDMPSRHRWMLIAICVSSPALFQRYGFDIGRFDVLGLAATLLSFTALDRGRLLLAAAISAVALLSHEAYVIITLPLLLAYCVRRPEFSLRRAVIFLSLPTVVFAALILHGTYEHGIDRLTAYFAASPTYMAARNGQVDVDAISVLTRNLRENFEYAQKMFFEKRAYIHIPIIMLWGAIMTWFFVLFYRLNGLRRDVLFYASFSPLLLSTIACDYYRWVSLAATNALFVILIHCRERRANGTVAVMPTGAAAWLLLATALLGPISNTKSFPIFFVAIERVFHVQLVW
jgi:hypothetical protein